MGNGIQKGRVTPHNSLAKILKLHVKNIRNKVTKGWRCYLFSISFPPAGRAKGCNTWGRATSLCGMNPTS